MIPIGPFLASIPDPTEVNFHQEHVIVIAASGIHSTPDVVAEYTVVDRHGKTRTVAVQDVTFRVAERWGNPSNPMFSLMEAVTR